MTKKLLQENSGKLFQSFFRGNSKTNKNNSYLSKNTIEILKIQIQKIIIPLDMTTK